MKLNAKKAAQVFRDEADSLRSEPINSSWEEKVTHFSNLCATGGAMTHIAFFGTELLAKAVDLDVDLFAVKPKRAPDNPQAYSARSLCKDVLVPLTAEFGINIGVTGREPLNNMPYFRMEYLGDGTPVHPKAQPAFDYMLELVEELSSISTEADARAALRAFLTVRRRYQVSYANDEGEIFISPEKLARNIIEFVQQGSDGGKRAQAVAAGLFDVVYGPERVESGRINDPSRKYPGDVCVRAAETPEIWEKAIEVRDKPVAASDVQIFTRKCAEKSVKEAAVVMAAEKQSVLQEAELASWALDMGVGLTLFHGWSSLVNQALFWADIAKPEAALSAVGYIEARLIGLQASENAVALWQELTRAE